MARMRTAGIFLFLRVFFLVVPTPFLVSASEACIPPGEYINASSGHISSPNFPNNYTANSICTWNITVLIGKIIKLTFLSFTLVAGENSNCTGAAAGSARVFIINVGSHEGNLDDFEICGQELPPPVYSKGNSIQVRFESRNGTVNKGFNATFEAIDGDSPCTPPGEYINASSGHISSPNFPNNYEANRTCIWNIRVFIGKIIKLIFLSFTLVAGENSNCTGAAAGSARVFITNVASHEGNLDDFEICGQELPPPVYSKGNSIQVRFESRNGTVNKGFNATFEAIDGDSSCLVVSGTQSTPSLPLDSSTSAVVPTQSHIYGAYLVVSGTQSTPSLPLDSSTSAVVPTQSHIYGGLSQSQSITPSTTSSIGKSFSNSSIEQVSASPSFSSHESVRTSSSLLHGGSTPSMETSRIAPPSSVVDHISLCECPCDTSSTFSAEKSSSVSDSESLSSFISNVFAQTSSVLAENPRSLYSESLSSSESMDFALTASVSKENSSSVYVSWSLSSSASSVSTQSHSVSAEKSWSVYSSKSLPLLASSSLMQDSSIPGQKSSMWYDSASRTSSASSLGLKIVSSTDTYRMSSSSASSVCYCPCNRSTVLSSPSSSMSISASKIIAPSPVAIPPASIMYPYGPQQEDNEFGLDDFPYYYSDLCLRINTDWTGIPFFSERLYKLYICRNGLIQLDFEWSWWWPRKFGIYWWLRNMGIIAPFWAITDTYLPFKYNHSKVYYQVYSQTQNKSSEILDLATRHVQDYIEGFGDFRANWVLVVTWEKLCPYSYYSYYYYSSEQNFQLNCPRSNTFQAVLITNGFNTFLMYNYPSKGIQWLVKADPEYYRYWTDFYGLPVAGWNAGNDGKNFVNLKGSGTFGLSDLDKEVGNTGLVGRHFWRIENSDGQGALEKCLSWVLQNKAWKFLERYNELIKSDSEMACPCTGWQAIFDWGRFRWNWWNSWPEFCFESRSFRSFKINTTSGPLDFQLRQKCCYSTHWQDWGSLKRGPPDGGRVDVTFRYDSNNSFYTDEQAYKSCCVDSLNCRLFYDLRPSDSCSNYVPRPRPWFWGDPHIKTLDGGNYTFNGLGEYTMVDAKNGTFKLQARTKLAQGNSTTATIFSAGAAKEENSSTIEVRVKDGGGFDILIDSASYDGYNNLTNQSVEVGGNLSFSKPKENCLQVSFLSTSSVQFCEKKEMMSFVVTLGNDFKNATKGLLGTWNGDPKDDFTLPNGTVLSSSSTLREIHFHFGVKWQINQSQSLFTYANNESVATFSKLDFMPMFADNITWHNDSLKQKAEAQCGDDHECLFDVASTKDLSIGSATKEISVQLVNDTKKLNNFPPKIVNTSEVINVTLHEIVELNITAVDDGPITFRVINKPVGATWNQTGAVLLFYWNVTSSKKFSLTFVAVDDQDASAIWSPTIKMCACQHDGQCVEPEEGDANNTDSKFIYMSCECQGGYTGRFCDRDIDACEVNGQPCYAGVDCTDRPPPANSSGYICGPCPSGHTGDGAKCVDINECQRINPCKQKCVNVPASFFCDCDNGYKLNDDGRSCGDINECLPTNDCMQKCDNSVGSYNCSCDEYFKTDPTDWRKCVAKDPCTTGHGCSHVCFKGSSGRATCACYANFELQSDGKTCKDINECDPAKKLHRCSQTCINTEGSYKCSCTEGYELKEDGYACEDINECLNDDLYNCTDNFHKCVNTRGSYKCECEQDLYFIDGKCKGLEKNQEPPKQPPPKPKNASENEKEQAVQFSIPSRAEWDLNRDKNFKEVLASVASKFCRKNRTKCGLKNARRKRRSLYDIYTADEVHLLPGYPKNSSDSLQVAFYVKQPAGGFIGNNSVLHRDTLVAIIIAYKSDIEKAIGANITDIETLFKPSTTTESPTAGPAEPADDDWKWIVIGVVIGVVVIILIGLLIFCIRKRKRDVKPITDPSQEGIAAQQSGLKKENSFESGSHSA